MTANNVSFWILCIASFIVLMYWVDFIYREGKEIKAMEAKFSWYLMGAIILTIMTTAAGIGLALFYVHINPIP